ncbi:MULTISPECIES: molybdopterin-dependent oxidoreductase [Anaerolinea]|uniref:Aldehyde oxidoreductase n=1 Tax=Anaerolinea thermophila (strain DSM 14523 / JCM 11388 / NBRC 100420 / UNI-1) TaxID=926569 RepID=E8N4Z5_ANATU|nr:MULTISPECIES: molybdopterin cofactor-binding domain-containing protein [Anaerolinea]BAJ63509.1 putative aldehyde oxidoreductase [Anaerolinea thermophila UNI-1]
MDTQVLTFWVNGKEVSTPVAPGEMLAETLRYRLGLTGTKIGCNEAECGACTVLVDGEAVLSCSFPSVKAQGRRVTTIEGLATPGREPNLAILHPLQQAFVLYGAVQCGFCIPGQIMTAYALLEKNPAAGEEEIRHALKDTLCRCGGYNAILQAIQAAGKAIQTGQPVQPPVVPEARQARRVAGRVHPRADAVAKVSGTAKYTDDLFFEGMLHARVKRAGTPAGILRRLDVSRARSMPGVVAVMTAEDLPAARTHGLVVSDWPVLVGVGEVIRTVGDALAIVAAETREQATQALDAIEVEIEPLPVVSDAVQALQSDAPKVHPQGNLLKHIKVRKGDVSEGFAQADVILEQVYHTPMHDHAFLEPECSIARPTLDGRMEIYVGSQIPYADRSQVARVLGVGEDRVHIIGMLIGGGFGGKEDIAGQIHAALLAQKTGRPVKLLFDRHESLLVHPKRHATQIRVRVGAKRDGTLTAVETELYGDTGAYASLGEKVMTRATTHSSGPYEIPHVKADCYAMYTNNPPAGAFRGFGVLQSAFAIESTMDTLAHQLGLDPIELRRKNALRMGSITNTGQVLKDSVGLLECIEKVEQELRRKAVSNPFEAWVDPQNPHLRRAWGFAVAYKNTGLGGGAPDKAGAEVELLADGTFEVRTASAELGQGLPTVLQLIAAEELRQLVSNVRVWLSDTDYTPDGGPTTASRQTYVTGNAVRYASAALREMITSHLAEHFDVSPEQIQFIEGLAQVANYSIPMTQVYEIVHSAGRKPVVQYTYWAPATKPLGEGGDMHFAYSFAAQAAEVEVNTLTGEVRVLEVITANDVGFAVNPLGLQGQIEGGVIMGIGHALTEAFLTDQGRVITDRLAKYRVPSITLTPKITSFVVEHPTADGPYGAKGVGEIVIIPTVPAITNAIFNAVGVRVTRLPVDQEWILRQIKAREAEFQPGD